MSDSIATFLDCRRIAVVGVSRTRGFGNTVLRTLIERGYDAVPVNANSDQIAGLRCFRSLSQITPLPEAVVSVVPPVQTEVLVDECCRLGIRFFWMQQGSESAKAIAKAKDAGITLVHHACILMYAKPRGIHRVHRWLHDLLVRQT